MSTADALAKALLKTIGGNDKPSTPSVFLTTGFAPLDHALSGSYRQGGLPSGRIVEMFGPSSCGKTAISTAVMAHAQAAGGIAGFNDHERSFHHELAKRLGLDVDAPTFIYKTPETFEESVTIAIKAAQAIREGKFINPKAPIAWVFDSLAGMVPQSKMAKDVTDYNMNDTTALARATSSVFPALVQWCEKLNMLALFLNQVRIKPGVVYGDPQTTPGGESPKFWASIRIQLGASRIMEGKGDEKTIVGQEISAKIIKNKVYRPFQRAKWRFMFADDGSGFFDVNRSLIDHLVHHGKLAAGKNDSYVVWTDGKQHHRQALAKTVKKNDLTVLLPGDDEVPTVEVEPEVSE
jgi:recombination protein RecA